LLVGIELETLFIGVGVDEDATGSIFWGADFVTGFGCSVVLFSSAFIEGALIFELSMD
jgi:hypothetical protein